MSPEAAVPPALAAALRDAVAGTGSRLTIAVSGGIDSLTLSAAAAQVLGAERVRLCHAVSAAVPAAATGRVRDLAARLGLALDEVDAGEFADARYRENPVNRCYFCKSALYDTLARLAARGPVAAGTNLDDLGDYRPGLRAAAEHGVRHPFVDAKLDKDAVRALARALGMGALSELPAAPCLASRIETGLRVEPAELRMIDAVEEGLRAALGPVTLRCRRRPGRLEVELDGAVLARLSGDRLAALSELARGVARDHGAADLPLTISAYRQGSGFIHA